MAGQIDARRRGELRDEILAIYKLLTHPAGFDVNLYGDLLTVRSTDQNTYEVEWYVEDSVAGHPSNTVLYRSFKCPLRAAATFVHYRHAWKLGEDYVSEACRAAQRTNSN